MDNLNTSLQENILTMLVFSDKHINLLVNNLNVDLFDNVYYKRIAELSINFYRKFNTPPKGHIADLLERELKNPDKQEIYERILVNIYESYDTLNESYILSELDKFIRIQNLKQSIKKAFELLQYGKVDEVESLLEESRKKRIELFNPGIVFRHDNPEIFTKLETNEEDLIFTGIEVLDKLEHVPTRKELYILMASPGKGKSWFLVHLAKAALLQRKKVLHISLELGEGRLIQRYFQALFGIATKPVDLQLQNALFETDSFGNISRIKFNQIPHVRNLKEEGIEDFLKSKMEELIKPQLIIKEFPTGSLSIQKLRAYLDNLEGYYNFIPDIILLDYLDLMDIDVDKLRIDLGRTAVELRGIAIERNLAMVTVAQSNRAGEDKAWLTRKNLGEDYSKVKTADVLITYNQLKHEKANGLARLFIDKGRNNRDGDAILISQNYSLGQFCLDSGRIVLEDYGDLIEK